MVTKTVLEMFDGQMMPYLQRMKDSVGHNMKKYILGI